MWKSLRSITIALILLLAPFLEARKMIGAKMRASRRANTQIQKMQWSLAKSQKGEISSQITKYLRQVQKIVANVLDLVSAHLVITSADEIQKDLVLMQEDRRRLKGIMSSTAVRIQNQIEHLQLPLRKKMGLRRRATELKETIAKAIQKLDLQILKVSTKLRVHEMGMKMKMSKRVSVRRSSVKHVPVVEAMEDHEGHHEDHEGHEEIPPPPEAEPAAAAA